QHGTVHGAVLGVLEPMIPPLDRFLQKPDGWPRYAVMRIYVSPRPDDRAPRYFQMLQHARNCVGIGIGPAADQHHGALDGAIVLADRAMAPVIVTSLVLHPGRGPERHLVKALHPIVPPAFTEQRRVRRA